MESFSGLSDYQKNVIRSQVRLYIDATHMPGATNLNNGTSVSIFIMKLAYDLDIRNFSYIQEVLNEMKRNIYFIGAPADKFAELNSTEKEKVVINDIIFPSFVGNVLDGRNPRSSGHKYVLYCTLHPSQKAHFLKYFDLTEEENMRNLEDVGMAVVSKVES